MDIGIELAVDTAGAHRSPPTDPHRDEYTVVRLVGVLEPSTAAELAARLRDALCTHGAVVADVSALRSRRDTTAGAFATALAGAGEWPDVRLALAAPDPRLGALLMASPTAQCTVVADDVPTAGRALARRPEVVAAHWDFAVSSHAPGVARGHVRRVCDRWAVDTEVCEAAEIVVTELVTNAVEHALSRSVVSVERRTGSFRMTVRDFDTHDLPAAVLPPTTSVRGRGLAMVAAVSQDWGVEHHPDGKTVWVQMTTA